MTGRLRAVDTTAKGEDEYIRMLYTAGIPRRYHNMALSGVPALSHLVDSKNLDERLEHGRGVTLAGGVAAYDGLQLVARNTVLQFKTVYMTALDVLVMDLTSDDGGELADRARTLSEVCVLRFYDSSYDACPLCASERYLVESQLMDWMDNYVTVSVHVSTEKAITDLRTGIPKGWWSNDLLTRLDNSNETINL